MLAYGFMRNALLAVLVITPLFGLLGTMIVSRKMAFFSDALGHSALTGIAVGVVMGCTDTDLPMLLFAVFFALLLNYISGSRGAAADTVISVFSSCSVATGLAVVSKGGNFSRYSSLLVGDILSITEREIGYLAVIFVLAVLFYTVCFNGLHAAGLHRTLAASRHIPVRLLENLFAVFVALVVTLSIKWVGILIINALLILPAAAGQNLAENMREYHFFAVLFSMFSGVAGLFVSYYTNVAAGPTIVIFAGILYFATYFYAKRS